MNPLEDISKDLKKYIRSAKLNGRTVLCAIDVDRTYSNLEGYSIYLNVPELLFNDPSDDLAKQFLRGYILSKGRSLSETEVLEDLETVVKEETANVIKWGSKVLSRHQDIMSRQERDKELNRQERGKPKVKVEE